MLSRTFHRVTAPRPGQYQGPRYSMGFFNQARRGAVIQGPKKVYPKIVSHSLPLPGDAARTVADTVSCHSEQTGEEFISQAMKVSLLCCALVSVTALS